MKIFLNVQGAATIGSAPSGLVSIPMIFSDGTTKEQGAVVAGMLGYKFHQGRRNLSIRCFPVALTTISTMLAY